MNRIRDFFARLMQGRYGYDGLNRFLYVVTLVLLIVSAATRRPVLAFIAIALIVYTYFRLFSRDFSAREREEEAFQRLKNKVFSFFRNLKRRLTDREHRYFKCPNCGKQLRVPKGKGTISIRCPQCRQSFTKRT